MKKFYNLKCKNKIYKIKDKILLLSKNICIRKVSKKLINKFLELFKIKKLMLRTVKTSYNKIQILESCE